MCNCTAHIFTCTSQSSEPSVFKATNVHSSKLMKGRLELRLQSL